MVFHKLQSQKVCSHLGFEKLILIFINHIGVWLLTTGLNKGVSKLIGQSVHRYRLLNEKSSKPTLIGLTSWGTVTEHTRNVLKYQVRFITVKMFLRIISYVVFFSGKI